MHALYNIAYINLELNHHGKSCWSKYTEFSIRFQTNPLSCLLDAIHQLQCGQDQCEVKGGGGGKETHK